MMISIYPLSSSEVSLRLHNSHSRLTENMKWYSQEVDIYIDIRLFFYCYYFGCWRLQAHSGLSSLHVENESCIDSGVHAGCGKLVTRVELLLMTVFTPGCWLQEITRWVTPECKFLKSDLFHLPNRPRLSKYCGYYMQDKAPSSIINIVSN